MRNLKYVTDCFYVLFSQSDDLEALENHPNYDNWGFHQRDYHIYLWALMEQINAKHSGCSTSSSIEVEEKIKSDVLIFPNPNNGSFTIKIEGNPVKEQNLVIIDIFGRIVKTISYQDSNQVELNNAGIYFLFSASGAHKIIVQ